MKYKNIIIISALLIMLMNCVAGLNLTDRLLTYYKFDETSGTRANDSVSGGIKYAELQNGAISNSGGKINYGISFDATDSIVDLSSNSLDIRNNNTGTIVCWAKFNTDLNEQSIFGMGQSTSTNGVFNFRRSGADKKLWYVFRTTAGGGLSTMYGNTLIGAGTYTMLTILSNGTKIKMYVNDTLQTITVSTGTNSGQWFSDEGTTQNTWSYGAFKSTSITNEIDGYMDECGYWDRELSQTNITSLFNKIKSGISYPFSNTVINSTNLTIKAKSTYNNSAINSFSVKLINGTTTKTYYTSTGTISKILLSDTRKYNITFYNVTNYFNKSYSNYQFSVSGNLEGLMNKKGAYINFFTKDNTMTEKVRITSSGFLGIATSVPQYMIHINSTNDGNILALQDTDGLCLHNPESASETITCSSDKLLKKNIIDTEIRGIDTINKYAIKDFTLVASGQVRTGVIAQELQQTMPDKVKNIDGILMVELPNIWTLAKAIQELNTNQQSSNSLINNLQNKNSDLINQITEANNKILMMQKDIATIKNQICTINKDCSIVKIESTIMTTNITNSSELI